MIIPTSAHGTNGKLQWRDMKLFLSDDDRGNINVDELKEKAEENKGKPCRSDDYIPFYPRRI